MAGFEDPTAGTHPRRRPRHDSASGRTAARSTRCSRATRCFRTWTCSRTSPSACARQGRPQGRDQRAGRARRSTSFSSRAASGRGPRQLSGGQQQRVALARALVNRPDVLLLDEPLGALDLKLRTDMQSQLKDLQRAVGITFCYVTHDQGEAFSMSDRVAVMNHGLLEQVGDAGGDLPPARIVVRRRLRRHRKSLRRPRRERRVRPVCDRDRPGRAADRRRAGGDHRRHPRARARPTREPATRRALR